MLAANHTSDAGSWIPNALPDTDCPASAPWHVAWTHSNFEQLVADHLQAKGFHPFLPKVDTWSVRAGRRRTISTPLFPGYVFLNDALDKATHLEVRKVRGVVRMLGESWERPAVVPGAEVEAIRRVVASAVPTLAHPYLREGRRAIIAVGPLAGVEGILVKVRPDKGLLVLSVTMLQRSVAVEVDCTQVLPA